MMSEPDPIAALLERWRRQIETASSVAAIRMLRDCIAELEAALAAGRKAPEQAKDAGEG